MADTLREEFAELVSDFAGQSRTLTINRAYIDICDGDHLKALFFSQLLYWSKKGAWFYKSYSDWDEELGLSGKQVRRISEELVAEGIIETAISKEKGARTVHYRVCRDKLADWIMTKRERSILPLGKVRSCPEGRFDPALREESLPYTRNSTLDTSHSDEAAPQGNPLNEKSVSWISQRFRSAGRKLGTAERRVVAEWLSKLEVSEEQVESALAEFFLDAYWRDKKFPPDAFRKQFKKYLDAATDRPANQEDSQNNGNSEPSAPSSEPCMALVVTWQSDVKYGKYLFELARTGKRVSTKQAKDGHEIWSRLTEAQKDACIEDIRYLVEQASEFKYVPNPVGHLSEEPWNALRMPAAPKGNTKQDRAMAILMDRKARRERGEMVL